MTPSIPMAGHTANTSPKRTQQQQSKNMRMHLDPNDPVNIEMNAMGAAGNTPN